MSQIKKAKDGYFTARGWICSCGLLARELVSQQEQSMDQKFWKCGRLVNQGEKQCKFFIWDADEVASRNYGTSTSSQVPETPTKRELDNDEPVSKRPRLSEHSSRATLRSTDPVVLPTPDSRDRLVGGNRRTIQRDSSPTPQRTRHTELNASGEKLDLSSSVLKLLHDQHIKLKTSTEMHLNHMIDFAEKAYETRLQELEETIFELRKKIAELDGDSTTVEAET